MSGGKTPVRARTPVVMRLFLISFLLMQLVALHHVRAYPSMMGKAVTTIGDIGEHYPLFLIEKNYHPNNIIVVYTKLDQHCRVLPDRAHGFMPTLDFYWLMDASRYKPMAEPLKEGVRQRLQLTDSHGLTTDSAVFSVRTNDLARVHHDLSSPTVQISTARHGETCVATASMTLGPSNGHTTMKVESVSTRTEAITLLKAIQAMAHPDALKIYAVTVKGTDMATGTPIERTYKGYP